MLLIISRSRKTARSISETFHFMSILSYGTTPHEALSEILPRYRAALIINPEGFPDIKDYVNQLKSFKSDLPIFAVTEAEPPSYYPDLFEATFVKPYFTPSLASKIVDYANEHNKAQIGSYCLAGFDASSNMVGTYYFWDRLNLTKTETMILRFLIVSYPTPQKADSIIKYAFRPHRTPERSSIRTHISYINKKLEKAAGRRMIYFVPGEGYVVMTPEYAEKFLGENSTSR